MKKAYTMICQPIYFVKTMLALMLVISIPFVGDISRTVLQIIPVWAAIILISRVKLWKSMLQRRYFFLLVLFSLSYFITILVNYRHNLFQNFKSLVWLIVYFGVLYTWEIGHYTWDVIKKDMIQINWIVIIINMSCAVPSVILYICNIGVQFQGRPLGIYEGRLFGISAALNQSALIALIAMLCAVMNRRLMNKCTVQVKIILWLNYICSYLFIIASGTRSVRDIMVGIVAICGLVYLYHFISYKHGKTNKLVRYVLSLMGAAFVFASTYAVVGASRYPVAMIPNVANEGGVMREEDGEERATAHRLDIWEESIILFKEHPVFGIGSANMKVYAEKSDSLFETINKGEIGVSTHSVPIAVLLFSGIMGVGFLMLFLTLDLITGGLTAIMIENVERDVSIVQLSSFLICVAIFVYGLTGTVIAFSNVEATVVFWIYLGMMDYTGEKIRERAMRIEK